VIKIRLYLDIAGGKADTPVMAAAAYLATESRWRSAERVWGHILDDAGADEFHATDFYSCKKKFSHLTKGSDEHKALGKRFLHAAQKYTKCGMAMGFDLRTYHHEMTEALRKTRLPYKLPKGRVMDPRAYAISYTLNRAARILLPRGTETAVIVESEAGIGAALDYMRWIKQKLREPWTDAFTSFTDLSKNERPLQMADLFAYHARYRIIDTLGDMTRPSREPMAVLAKSGMVYVHLSTADDFRTSAGNVFKFLREYPRYAVGDEDQ